MATADSNSILAVAAESGVPLDAVRMARKKMWVSCAKAQRELGFSPSGADLALGNAVRWFEANGYC